jgi:hypothetical protein
LVRQCVGDFSEMISTGKHARLLRVQPLIHPECSKVEVY